MKALDQKVMFAHFKEPIPLRVLRSDISGGAGHSLDMNVGAQLNFELCLGGLRSATSDKLLAALRATMPEVPHVLALVLWIAAVRRHPEHRHKSALEVSQEVIAGKVPLNEFLPIDLGIAA